MTSAQRRPASGVGTRAAGASLKRETPARSPREFKEREIVRGRALEPLPALPLHVLPLLCGFYAASHGISNFSAHVCLSFPLYPPTVRAKKFFDESESI